MLQPKYMGIAAAGGFVLSFLVGIFAGIGFGHIMLRALVCALAFGALCAGILFLNQKFLSDGRAGAVSDASADKTPRTGGIVDITIDDDRLPEEEQGPRFNVATTRPALRAQTGAVLHDEADEPSVPLQEDAAPVTGQQETVSPAPSVEASDTPQADSLGGFTPMGLAQVASSGAEQQPKPVAAQAGAELADLPDIGSFSGEGAAETEVVQNAELAEVDASPAPRRSVFPDGGSASGQSASVMAQAIRTILAKD